jgi:nucleotide-binding universal stress UspA family protein
VPCFHAAHDPHRAGYLPPRRILVVVDPAAPEQLALDKAARIAAHCGSSLELYVCDEQQQLPESWAGEARLEEYRKLRRQRQLAELHPLAQPLREQGLSVEVVCEWHAPAGQGIGHQALRTQPDLIVKQTPRQARRSGVTPGDADLNLIGQVPMPLLLVGARHWPAVARIAAAINPAQSAGYPTGLDTAIVGESRALARVLDGTLAILHMPHVLADAPDVLVVGTAAQLPGQVDCDLLVVKPPGFVSALSVTPG